MSFERAEMDWLLNLWETEPVPWREPVLFMYLRYVDGCIIRRVSYWTPERCCLQVRGAAKRGEWIGRRALHDVSGCGERRARNLIDERALWADPYRPCPGLANASADGEDCGADETPCPGSADDASRVRPAGDDNDADGSDIDGPGSVPGASRVESRVGPDRAVTSARDHRSPSDTFMYENTQPPAHAGHPRGEPGSGDEHGTADDRPTPATPGTAATPEPDGHPRSLRPPGGLDAPSHPAQREPGQPDRRGESMRGNGDARSRPSPQPGVAHAPQAARDDAHPGRDPRSGGEVGGDGQNGVATRIGDGLTGGGDHSHDRAISGGDAASNGGLLPLPGLSVDIPAVMPPLVQSWVPSVRNCHGYTRADVEAMVLRCVAAIKGGGKVNPVTCKVNAKVVLGLWSALGHPAPEEMAGEVELVAEWAQLSPDKLAARDIRAEGWAEGTDRSRSLKTLTVRVSWSDRLDAARAWVARGKPTTAATPAPPAEDPLVPVLVAVLEDLTANQGDATRCADPVRARRALDRLYKVGGNIGIFASTPAEWRAKAYRETAATMLRHAAAERAKAQATANG